jgi:recombinational DNA repair protein (RecF pathway)
MAYQTYITEAIVCGSWNRNTADKSILLFSREAGMVYVQAKSVRKEISKQRYALQDASYIRATLIRGKTGWKIAGTESLQNFYMCADTREARALLRDTILLLRRVIRGETPHPDIFDDVVHVLRHENTYPCTILKSVLFVRILYILGYVVREQKYEYLFENSFPFTTLIRIDDVGVAYLNTVIKNALIQ